jgi:hypothetical protein
MDRSTRWIPIQTRLTKVAATISQYDYGDESYPDKTRWNIPSDGKGRHRGQSAGTHDLLYGQRILLIDDDAKILNWKSNLDPEALKSTLL